GEAPAARTGGGSPARPHSLQRPSAPIRPTQAPSGHRRRADGSNAIYSLIDGSITRASPFRVGATAKTKTDEHLDERPTQPPAFRHDARRLPLSSIASPRSW